MANAIISHDRVWTLLDVLGQWPDCQRSVLSDAELPTNFTRTDAILPDEVMRLYRSAIRALEERTRIGSSEFRHTQDMSDLLGFAVIGSETLEEAIARIGVFNRSIVTGTSVDLQVRGHRARLQFDTHRGMEGRASRLVDGSVLMIYHRLLSWLAGRHIPLWHSDIPVDGGWDAQPGGDDYAPHIVGIEFERDWLRAPVICGKGDLAQFNGMFPFLLCFGLDPKRGVSASLTILFEQRLGRGKPLPSVGEAASILRLSEQALRRRLSKEGTFFQNVREECLRKRAEALLTSSDLNVADISEQLGFSDERSFRRAFRRWTHHSPSHYKERQGFRTT
ncbi:transcriptional regulator [Sphingobium sp. TomMM35A]